MSPKTAAAAGLPISRLAVLEPPIGDEDTDGPSDFISALVRLAAAGRHSEGSTDDLTGMAATVARGLPDGKHISLPGECHGPRDEDLASALIAFFTASGGEGNA